MKMSRFFLLLLLTAIMTFAMAGIAAAANIDNLTITTNQYDIGKADISYTVNAYLNEVTLQTKCNGKSSGNLIALSGRAPNSYVETVDLANIPGLDLNPSAVTFILGYKLPANGKIEWVKQNVTLQRPFESTQFVLPSGITIDVKNNNLNLEDPVSTYLSGKVEGIPKKQALNVLLGKTAGKLASKISSVISFFVQANSFNKKTHAWEVFAYCAASERNLPAPETLNKYTFWKLLDQELQFCRHKSLTDPNLTSEDIEYVMENSATFRSVWVLKGLKFTQVLGNKALGICY